MHLLGAFTAIVDDRDRLLLMHRNDIDVWEMPGGGVDDGESPWEAAVRETSEEVGLDIEIDRLVGVYWKPLENTTVFQFVAAAHTGRPRPSDEADDVGWFGFDDLPPNVRPAIKERIADVRAGAKQTVLRTQTRTIREVRPDEYDHLGAITRTAYTILPGHVDEPDYENELAAVARRANAPGATVLVAVESNEVVGGVTYVADATSPLAEWKTPKTAGIRMLAVAPHMQGKGVGESLTRACIDRARAEGNDTLFLHSTQWMHGAHRLYERLGFRRAPGHDWAVTPGITLLAFTLGLT
jgi:8-oxo-dGTP pyrophosphatase MutT (NUDIX family)/predicted N-acetyltransferase YhbS